MKRWILSISLLIVILSLTFVSLAGWMLNTTAGAEWLIETLPSSAGVRVTTGRVEGQLADDLLIDDLTFAWPDGQISIHKIHLVWEPLSVLDKNLKIGLLVIDQFVITDLTPDDEESPGYESAEEIENDIGFSVNDLRALPNWLVLDIADLQFKGLVYEAQEDSVTIIEAITGSFVWTKHQIVSSAFNYTSPFVDFKGHFDWDLRTPHLEMVADVHLPEELVNHELFRDIDVPVDFPGLLSIDGDWNDFSGPVSFGTETSDMSRVWLAADAQGSWQGIELDQLKGYYLGGRLEGDLDLWWIDFFRMHGQVLGSGLSPGLFLNGLEGLATLDVVGELFVPYDENPLQASIGIDVIEGELRGTNVSGDIEIDWQFGDFYEVDIDLNSEDSRLFVKGKPSDKLNVDVSIGDLSFVYAGLAGQLNSSGWLRWREDYLSGEMAGSGADFVWQGASLRSFDFQARHMEKQSPIEVVIDGRELSHDHLHGDLLHAEVTGSLEEHRLMLTVDDKVGTLTTELTGGYLNELWKGQLLTFKGESSDLGSWSLVETSSLFWEKGSFSLDKLSLSGTKGGNFTLKAQEIGSSEASSLALEWTAIQHEWLRSLHSSVNISGKSAGQIKVKLFDNQPTSLMAQVDGNLSLQNKHSPLELPSMTLEMIWVEAGLDLDLLADTEGGEHFEIKTLSSQPPSWQWPPEQLSFVMNWDKINLNRLSPFFEDLEVEGDIDGTAQFEIVDGQLLHAKATTVAEGQMHEGSQLVGFNSLVADLLWNEATFKSEVHVKGIHDGLLALKINSTADPDYNLPDSGDVDLQIENFDLRSFLPFLSVDANIVGAVQGHSNGSWRDNGDISFQGHIGPVDNTVAWHLPDGQVAGTVRQAGLDWQWQGQGQNLEGQLSFELESGGAVQGRWKLPLTAHWPATFISDGSISADFKGDAKLIEILPLFAPGVFQDVLGDFTTDLHLSGSLESPYLTGTLNLLDAGAYVPITGATIEDMVVNASMRDDEIHLNRLSLKMGDGIMDGTGLVEFEGWGLEGFRLDLHGDRLKLFDFPELQLLCSPELTFSGGATSTRLRGSLLIPEMNLIAEKPEKETLPSKDVIIAGEVPVERDKLVVNADIQVVVELGDDVKAKTTGVQTRLEGGVTIGKNEKNNLAGWGEIRLVDGVYKAYGLNLEIKQGLMSYVGSPLVNPTLRVFAAKDIGRVQAGVHITGTPENPIVTLASIPAMPERDIIGYIFMGRPIRKEEEGGDALTMGAGALFPNYGQTFSDYGIVELDLDGLMNDEGGVRLRKRLAESWEISSTLGVESGVDIFYLLDFD